MRRAAILSLALPFALAAQTAGAACVSPPAQTANPIRVPMAVVNNHVYVQVCVAGRVLDFILDTGAGGSPFDLGVARELGLASRGEMRARGAGAGTVQGARLDTIRVQVGGTTQLLQSAIDFSGVSLGEGSTIHGLLGGDFIARWVLAIDYQAGMLELYDPETFKYSGPGTAIKIISFDRNHPHIRADVVVGGKTIGIKAIVDVGAASALSLTKPFVEKHKLLQRVTPTIRTIGGGGVGGASMTTLGRVDALKLGPYTLERPVTAMYGDSAGVFSEDSWDANIGGEVLRRFKVYFDYTRRQMILEPRAEALAEAFDGDMSGLRMRGQQRLDSVAVMWVMPGSPADEAGIKAGDVVVAVEGQPVTSSTLREVRARLRRPNESVGLTVIRNATRVEVRLTTRRLI